MKYVGEYREPKITFANRRRDRPSGDATALMEVCGVQTHTLMRAGINGLLPHEVEIVS